MREKPTDPKQARAWLAEYAGKSVTCVSGVIAWHSGTRKTAEGVATTHVSFGPGLAAPGVLAAATAPGAADGGAWAAWGGVGLRPSVAGLVGEEGVAGAATAAGVRTVSVMDAAGGFMVEHPAIFPHVVGVGKDGLSGVWGLPSGLAEGLIKAVC